MQLYGKLIPNTAISAVFNNTIYILWRTLISWNIHHSGGTHWDAMQHDGWTVWWVIKHLLCHLRPVYNVVSVFPSHLYVIAFAQPMSVKVWQQNISISLLVIYACYCQKSWGAIFVAMYYNSSSTFCRVVAHVKCMVLLSVRHYDKGVSQQFVFSYAVSPLLHIRMFLV